MTINRTALALVLAATALAGCGNARDMSGAMRGAGVRSRSAATRSSTWGSTSLSIEEATQKLDLGKQVKSASATLERIVADPKTSPGDHDRAALALSRAYEAEGKHEQAIRTVENLLATRHDDHHWALKRAAAGQLRKLLTGKSKAPPPSFEPDQVVSPFARVLAPYFPVVANKRLTVKILLFGGSDATSARLGTFAIGDAARERRLERCPLCQADLERDISISRTSWTGIPAERDQLSDALDVFYFDLGADRIPNRYAKYLPMAEKDIVSHLENGDGLIAARTRKGAPPSILIAAPRRAELPDVEEALSKQTRLPEKPIVVKVSPKLRRGEIRGVMRAAFAGLKKCYNELLERSPSAGGKVMLDFTIGPDGSMRDNSIDAAHSSLQDSSFDRCILDVTGGFHFPATGKGKTTVNYPITFSPDTPKTP